MSSIRMMSTRMLPMQRIARVLAFVFALQLLGVLALGVVGSLRLELPALRTAAMLGALAWLLLARSTLAAPGTAWNSWLGTLQFVACWMIFPLFKAIRLVFIEQTADARLLTIDRWLWGGASLPEHALAWESPVLSELVSTGYLLFYFMVLAPALVYSFRRRSDEARAFFVGLSTMYLFGFAGYLLVPAGGPYIAFPDIFPYPAQGGPITALLTRMVAGGITGMDVFPSLHVGISAYVLGFLFLCGHRKLAALLLPAVLALTVATVYLRYHYGFDLLCGLALAAVVLIFVHRYRKESRACIC